MSGMMNKTKDAVGCTGWFIGVLVVVLFVATGLYWLAFTTSIGPSQWAVVDKRPLIFGSAGIQKKALRGPRLVHRVLTTKIWKISAAPIEVTVHAQDFIAKDRVPLDFDISITLLMHEPERAPEMIDQKGLDPESLFRRIVLQNTGESGKKGKPTGEFMSFLRDQIRTYESQVFIAGQTTEGKASSGAHDVEKATIAHINAFLAANGAGMVKLTNVALGRANPPAKVLVSMEDTAKQAQERKTQDTRVGAETARKAAEIAAAKADRAYMNEVGFSPELFIESKRIDMQRAVCKDGGCVFVVGGGAQPVVQIPPKTIEEKKSE